MALYALSKIFSFFVAPYLFEGLLSNLLFWIFFIILLLSVLYIPIALKSKKFSLAFLASAITIAMVISLSALSLYPRLVPSNIDLANYSLTIFNASSTKRTLETMLIIALIGIPIVLVYTIWVYRIFKGKVLISKDNY